MPRLAVKKRPAQINVRLTPEEKLLLEETARQEGFKGLSDFIRHGPHTHVATNGVTRRPGRSAA
jgi:hypothetical protein